MATTDPYRARRDRQAARGIPEAANAALAAGFFLLQAWQWILLPLYFLPADPRWGWTLVPVVLTTTTLWALLHEAFHGILFRNAAVNDTVGRILAVLLGASFRVLRFGHLMHHRFNRTALESPDLAGRAARARPQTWAIYYLRLTVGLFLAEAAGTWLSLLPRGRAERIVRGLFGAEDETGRSMLPAAQRILLAPRALRDIRIDALATLTLTAAGLALYDSDWPMLAAALLARGFLLSFFDNAYHYGTPPGAILSGMNLRLPRWTQAAILNFNLHGVHHHAPSLPWRALPRSFERTGAAYHDGYFRAALRQLKGPVARDAATAAPGTV
jgi:fatty acid desaturase